MDGNIFDIFGIPVQEIPEGAVLQWDGCRWTLVELPGDVLLCDDIVDCVQGELDNIWSAVHNKIGCSDLASCAVIGSLQDQINNLPASVIDQVKFYINTVNDGQTSTYANEDTITIYGLDGLRFLTNPSTGVHELRLPSGANDWDVLVWRDSMNGASWETIEDCLCNQIATCPSITALENMYTGLQNQVNYLLGLDPSDQPVLTCSDVARCIWAGTTDVDHAMAEWIINWIEWESLQTLLTTIQSEIDTILIRNCNDVMACQGIQTLANVQAQLVVRMDDAEGEIAAIWPVLNSVTSTVATHTGLISALQDAVDNLEGQANTNVINTCADVMACDGIQGLLTGYTQLNTIVGDHVGEISALWAAVNPLVSTVGNHGGRITALEADVLTLQGHITSDAILTCNDVMACSGILGLVSDVADLDGRITAMENCCGAIDVVLGTDIITEALRSIIFNHDQFSVEQLATGTVGVKLDIGLGEIGDGVIPMRNSDGYEFVNSMIREENNKLWFSTNEIDVSGGWKYMFDGTIGLRLDSGTNPYGMEVYGNFGLRVNSLVDTGVNMHDSIGYIYGSKAETLMFQGVDRSSGVANKVELSNLGKLAIAEDTGHIMFSKYLNNPSTVVEGNWRIRSSGSALLIEKYESGNWAIKHTFS